MYSDPYSIMEFIETLPWDHDSSPNVYMKNSIDDDAIAVDNDAIAVKVISKDKSRKAISGQLAKIRYSDLPKIEKLGDLSELALPQGAGLFEASHFTYYYDSSPHILALEFNIIAPRHKALGDYLVNKLFNHPTVHLDEAVFHPIIRGDVLDQVMAMGPVGEMILAVRRDGISEIDAADDKLGTALKAQAAYAPEMAEVGFYLSRKKHSRTGGGDQNFKQRVLGTIRKFLHLFSKASVKVEDEKGQLVEKNLLSDKLIHTVTTSQKSLSQDEMLSRIDEAYALNSSLLRANSQQN